VEYLGADTLLDTRISDQPFTVRVSGRAVTSPGESVSIRWEPSAAHWFDQSSQRRIDN
jgi:sn-glycerol 3-phosphate transport system ATP-binding protein